MIQKDDAFIRMKQDELQAFCREKGLPLTVQRRVVMDALAGRTDHPSADQLYEQVKEAVKGISRTTVYRVIEVLVDNGIIRKVGSHEAKARFDANAARHHHIECMSCGAVADVAPDASHEIELPDLEALDFEVTDYTILFQGTCGQCRGKHT